METIDNLRHLVYNSGVAHPDLDRLTHYIWAAGLHTGDWQSTLQAISAREQETFIGTYDSTADYTEQLAQDLYGYEINSLPTWIRNNIDYAQAFDRELRHDLFDFPTFDNSQTWIWHAH